MKRLLLRLIKLAVTIAVVVLSFVCISALRDVSGAVLNLIETL